MVYGDSRKKLLEKGYVAVRVYISPLAKNKIIQYQNKYELTSLDLAIDKYIIEGGK